MLNPALFQLAQRRVWSDEGGMPMEKVAVVPPDPAMMGGGGAPPMDPAMAGGAPPMDPAMAGGAPPMDPAMAGGAPPMDPTAMAGMPGPPAAGGAMPGMAPGVNPATGQPQKMKPEQYMQMLDFRLYNIQQQITTLLNAMDIKMDPGVLVTPPGAPMGPPPEAAMQGGPQDTGQGADAGGGGGASAISPIEPMQAASPELAAGGGGGGMGGEKMGSAITVSDWLEKAADGKADTRSTEGDVDEEGPRHSAPPSKDLRGPHPGVRPGTQAITAGGSKDPLSRPETEADMGPVNTKSAAQQFASDLAADARTPVGTPFDTMQTGRPVNNAAAVAAMLRSRSQMAGVA